MRLRADEGFYFVFTLMFGLPAACLAVFSAEKDVALFLGGLYVATILWLRGFEIVVGPDHIEFKSPFTKRNCIRYSEIDFLRHFQDEERFTLQVVPKAVVGRRPFAIACKMFAREDLEVFFNTVRPFVAVEDSVFGDPKARSGANESNVRSGVNEPTSTKLDAIFWLMMFVSIGSAVLYLVLTQSLHEYESTAQATSHMATRAARAPSAWARGETAPDRAWRAGAQYIFACRFDPTRGPTGRLTRTRRARRAPRQSERTGLSFMRSIFCSA